MIGCASLHNIGGDGGNSFIANRRLYHLKQLSIILLGVKFPYILIVIEHGYRNPFAP
jgi:hypothetical protein